MPPRKRRSVTVRKTTTQEVTLAEETHDDTMPILAPALEPLTPAPGWNAPLRGRLYRAQRATQLQRCVEFLAIWAVSAQPGTPPPDRLIGDATVILRAGPNATMSELTLGRTV
jgi:hypothetical protein